MKRRAGDVRYDRSEKGKTRAARYNSTRKGRDRYIEYNHSSKGLERTFARYMRNLNARCEANRERRVELEALIGPNVVVMTAGAATLAEVDALLGIR